MNQDQSVTETGPAWTQPGWLEEVRPWIEEALARDGRTISGPIEQPHIRPWSTALRIPASGGEVYFKAVVPSFRHEIAITAALYRWRPDAIPAVLRSDAGRGWMLIASGGETLRQALQRQGAVPEAPTIDSWREIIAFYARLQIDLAAHVDELLVLGAPDRRLHLLPALYGDLLAEKEWLLLDQPDGLTTAEYERLLAATPQVDALCRKLAAYKIPMSLHHNDLHDANIFYGDGRVRFFDWGDSSVAHPFFSLRTVFVSIEYTFDLEEGDPFFASLAQEYLRPWVALAPEADLTAAFGLAQRLWALSTAIKYKAQTRWLPAWRKEVAHAVPGSLQEFLEANPAF